MGRFKAGCLWPRNAWTALLHPLPFVLSKLGCVEVRKRRELLCQRYRGLRLPGQSTADDSEPGRVRAYA